ncbi:MAG: CoA transferase, partial [Syntrophobacteraceae bacterium]
MERWQTIQYKPAPLFAPVYGPMTGLRVLLSASVVAAPHAATMLGEFGAEIIQVEICNVRLGFCRKGTCFLLFEIR